MENSLGRKSCLSLGEDGVGCTEDDRWCEDRVGTGPPRVKTEVIYVDLRYWSISGSIHSKGDPASGL